MATSKKVTELIPATAVTADDLMYVVNDPLGTPTSNSITVKHFMESNVTANVAANGSLVVTQRALANAITIAYNATPVNSATVPAGFSNNTIWTDGSFIYVVTGTGQLKRTAIATW